MSDITTQFSPQTIDEMRGWLADCFEDLPAELTTAEIVAGVSQHYEGGIPQFLTDALVSDGHERGQRLAHLLTDTQPAALIVHLAITLGNDAMDNAADVAGALRRIAQRLEDEDSIPTNLPIRDENGNTVGSLTVSDVS